MLVISPTAAVADNTEDDDHWSYGRHAQKKHHHNGRTLHVDRDHEQTLTEALEIAREGTTIRVEGTCSELVTITTGSLTLEGGGEPEATSVITIDCARNITITGFIVQHSPGAGIWKS